MVLALHTAHQDGDCTKHCITQGCLHTQCITQWYLHYTLHTKRVIILNSASHRGACICTHYIKQERLHYTLHIERLVVLNIPAHKGASMHTASRIGAFTLHIASQGGYRIRQCWLFAYALHHTRVLALKTAHEGVACITNCIIQIACINNCTARGRG